MAGRVFEFHCLLYFSFQFVSQRHQDLDVEVRYDSGMFSYPMPDRRFAHTRWKTRATNVGNVLMKRRSLFRSDHCRVNSAIHIVAVSGHPVRYPYSLRLSVLS